MKPIKDWNFGILMIGFVLFGTLFIYVALSGQCLDPYNSCVATWKDYALPLAGFLAFAYFSGKK